MTGNEKATIDQRYGPISHREAVLPTPRINAEAIIVMMPRAARLIARATAIQVRVMIKMPA